MYFPTSSALIEFLILAVLEKGDSYGYELITIRIPFFQYGQDEKFNQGRGCWKVHGKPPFLMCKIFIYNFSTHTLYI